MRTLMGSLAVAVTVSLVFTGAVNAQDKASSGSPERGKKLYIELSCYTCHGTHGQGGGRGSEPKISRPLLPATAFAGLLRRPPRDMPAYTRKWVSDQDVVDLYAYLTSLKPSPASKDIPLLNQM
jgi:cytochrome c